MINGKPNGKAGAAFKLPLHLKQMGESSNCRHRAGWPFVMARLRVRNDPSAILLDDFVERSFQHPQDRQVWREPWVGIFHHPQDLPGWLDPSAPPEVIFSSPEFAESRTMLRGAIALSAHLGAWLEKTLGCPVLVLKHPTEIPQVRFSIDRFLDEDRPRLIQVGWYGRNQRAIYQVPAPANFRKVHLLQDRPWVRAAIERTDTLSPLRDRGFAGEVEVIAEVDNNAYDRLFESSLIFNQYWAISASNTVIEAIARGAPLVVNRHPALLEYVGPDYPLFYEDLDEVSSLLADKHRIIAAADLLAEADTSWVCPETFASDVARFVQALS